MAEKKPRSNRFRRFRLLLLVAGFCTAILCACTSGTDRSAQLGSNSDSDIPSTLPEDIAEVRFLTIPAGMALIPAGLAVYGCDKELDVFCGDYDIDLSIITNNPYLIDITEVPWGDYRVCVSEGACPANECLPVSTEADNLPAACVPYADAEAFCVWAGKRLPTDLEWERAARGLNGLDFPWGNTWCETCLNWSDNGASDGSVDGYAQAAPVDAFADGLNLYGLYNLSGNVWELTLGNAEGEPVTGENLFARGGAFFIPEELETETDPTVFYRTTRRYPLLTTDYSSDIIGFRCAADPVYE